MYLLYQCHTSCTYGGWFIQLFMLQIETVYDTIECQNLTTAPEFKRLDISIIRVYVRGSGMRDVENQSRANIR